MPQETVDILEQILADTNQNIGDQQGVDVGRDVAERERKLVEAFESAMEVDDEEERDRRLQIIEADLESVRASGEKRQDDFARVLYQLDAFVEGMGTRFEELKNMPPEGQKLIDDAQDELTAAEADLRNTESMINFFGRRTRAVTAANERISVAKSGVEGAESEAELLRRDQLQTANIEASMQTFLHVSDRAATLLIESGERVAGELVLVVESKRRAFETKERAATAMEETQADVDRLQAELEIERQRLETMPSTSADHAKQSSKVTDLESELSMTEGNYQKAFSIFQSKEKFAAHYEVYEATLILLRDNLKIWQARLQSDSEDRSRTFQARLIALQASSDQDVAMQIDRIGVQQDQEGLEELAEIGVASQRARIERSEQQPELMRAAIETTRAFIEAQEGFAERDRRLKEETERQYGVKLRSSVAEDKDSSAQGF